METDTQKLTKLHVQPGNHCSLKIYQAIYIDHTGCIALHVNASKLIFMAKNASQCCPFKVKFKRTSVFLDF